MGWYLLDQLLSKALNYDFDVNILRAALPAIRAVYTKGTVANETIVREELVTIAFSGNQLCVTARQAIRRMMVYSFEGDLLGTNGQMEQGDIYRRYSFMNRGRLGYMISFNAHSKVLIMPIVSSFEWALLDAYDRHCKKR